MTFSFFFFFGESKWPLALIYTSKPLLSIKKFKLAWLAFFLSLWYPPSRWAGEWMLTRLILVNISPICDLALMCSNLITFAMTSSRTTCQSISLCFFLSWNTGLAPMWKCSLSISNPTPQQKYISRLMRSQFNSNQITSNSSSFNHFKKK